MSGLVIDALSAGYGGVTAIRDVTFSCGAGEVLAILGPNGAGKTTTLLAIAGVLRPMSGKVLVGDRDITGNPPYVTARRGLMLLPDDRGLFSTLSVAEHLRLAERSAPARRRGTSQLITRSDVIAQFPQLSELLNRQCGLLSGGEQQMLAIAKTLMLSPSVLLVDELSLGLAPILVQGLVPRLSALAKESGMALILVEQHYEVALAASTCALVMSHGRVVLAGSAAQMLADPAQLEAAYFGGSIPEHRE